MPRKKRFDKNSSTTYQLLHRPQNDPRIHDPSSSSMVFAEVAPNQAKKARTTKDLEDELFGDEYDGEGWSVRDNEGEAAEHGIYYDDTDYDYMQHMRGLGNEGTQATWVEAPKKDKSKGKEKVSLDEALKDMDLSDSIDKSNPHESTARITDPTILPSNSLRKTTYQDQQDIPDALRGFQPDMDPRLREALEALEDEAYVDADSKDDDFFTAIAKDGEELSLAEFEELGYVSDRASDDAGWSTDDTAKPIKEYKDGTPATQTAQSALNPAAIPADSGPDHGDGDFMASFRDLPKASRAANVPRSHRGAAAASVLTGASVLTAGGRHKKRKGAKTNSEAYSMTSSSLYRTEGLTLLDARFDKTLETYEEDEDEDGWNGDDDTASVATGRMSMASGISGVSGMSRMSGLSRASRTSSQAPDLVVRKDFEDIMDEFLEGHSMQGKKRVKKGKYQSGMEQLDEVRKELGKPVGPSIVGPRAGFV